MGKSYTLKGAACMAFINAQRGTPAETDDDKAMRIATFVHLNMQVHPEVAASLILRVAREGLEATARMCTSDRGELESKPRPSAPKKRKTG